MLPEVRCQEWVSRSRLHRHLGPSRRRLEIVSMLATLDVPRLTDSLKAIVDDILGAAGVAGL